MAEKTESHVADDARTSRNAKRSRAKQSTERAYAAIRAAILDGRYARGERLVEDVLAAETGVSRTPVREALRRLAGEGMIRYGLGMGATVADWTAIELDEIMVLRVTLESLAAQLAARRITAPELAELTQLNEVMRRAAEEQSADSLNVIAEANDRFHKKVAHAARNGRLLEIIGGLIEIPLVLRTFRRYSEEELRRSLNQHQDLISALADRDADWAAAVMRSHILSARKSAERSIGPQAL